MHPNKYERLLTTRDVALMLGVSMSKLEKWRCYGGGPDYIKIGGSVRYRESSVLRFIEGNMRGGLAGQRPTDH